MCHIDAGKETLALDPLERDQEYSWHIYLPRPGVRIIQYLTNVKTTAMGGSNVGAHLHNHLKFFDYMVDEIYQIKLGINMLRGEQSAIIY